TRATTFNETGGALEKKIQEDKEIIMISEQIGSILALKYPLYDFVNKIFSGLYYVLPVSISIIVKLLLQHGRKLFKFYLAKASFNIASKQITTELDKAR